MLPTSGKRNRGRYGFTLLELLLVVTVMAVMTSVALPRFSGLGQKTRLEQGAKQLASFVRHGRIEAVKRGLKVRLEFGEKGATYRLSVQDSASKYRESFTDFEDAFLDDWHAMPDRVKVVRVSGAEGEAAPGVVTFHPKGSSTATKIVVQDSEDNDRTILLDSLPTDVRVVRHEDVNAQDDDAEDLVQ